MGIPEGEAKRYEGHVKSNSDPTASPTNSVPADNSKNNRLDQSNMTATAEAQKDDKTDRTLTQRIRKSVMSDKSLSTYAHNVKIIAVNGIVTLNGVVHSDQEKSKIEAKAVSVAGQGHVVNDLKVVPATSEPTPPWCQSDALLVQSGTPETCLLMRVALNGAGRIVAPTVIVDRDVMLLDDFSLDRRYAAIDADVALTQDTLPISIVQISILR